jgi:hypothetical protein
MCKGDMEVHTIEVSHKMWMCPWCDYPYFPHEEEAMKANYCRSCYIKWDVILEKPKKFPRTIVIPARQHGRTFEREYQNNPTHWDHRRNRQIELEERQRAAQEAEALPYDYWLGQQPPVQYIRTYVSGGSATTDVSPRIALAGTSLTTAAGFDYRVSSDTNASAAADW